MPPSSPPCGILFVGHGCSHAHTDWFVHCQDCLGLPEERGIVKIALKFNLMVVAMSSENKRSRCWEVSKDGPRVASVLHDLSQRFSGQRPLPIYAFGASSGGTFVSNLHSYLTKRGLKLDAFVSQIMAASPPISVNRAVYITMNRDKYTDAKAKKFVFNSHRDTKIKQIRLPPLEISEAFFSERIVEVTKDQSNAIMQSLKGAGFLDAEGLLREDPRRSAWRALVRPHVPQIQDSLEADQSPISEVLNVAYAKHEMARDGVEEALEFCLADEICSR